MDLVGMGASRPMPLSHNSIAPVMSVATRARMSSLLLPLKLFICGYFYANCGDRLRLVTDCG